MRCAWLPLFALMVGGLLAGGCSPRPSLFSENTLVSCGDGADNDGDGLVDCADDDCMPYCGQALCGDGTCDALEDCLGCESDCGACPAGCGDSVCDAATEDCLTCVPDCGMCAFCGDGTCGAGEDCDSCEEDCGTCAPGCGDGTCEAAETCTSCPSDCGTCGPVCGDGSCAPGETCTSCAADCGTCGPVCGNGSCEAGETCSSCAADCGTCGPVCGNGTCEAGESCGSCSSDCGTCGPVCGNGTCEAGESCGSCSSDCGTCPPAGTVLSTVTCSPNSADRWSFPVNAGDTIHVVVDTVDAATAFDIYSGLYNAVGAAVGTEVDAGDDELVCSFPPPQYACPEYTYVAATSGTYEVSVEEYCSCPGTGLLNYSLLVEVNGVSVSLTQTVNNGPSTNNCTS